MALGLAGRRSLPVILRLIVLAVLLSCGAEESGDSGSAGATEGTASVEMGGAQGGLGPEVEKIMGSPFYRYGEWGSLAKIPVMLSS